MTIVTPTGATQWVRGTSYNVKWSSTGAVGTLTLTLKKSGMADVVLSSTENNDGTYLLQGSATNSLTAGTGYTLVLTDGSTSVTSNSFVVVNPRTISSVQTSPSACVVGQACSISFTLGGGVSSVSLVYSGMSTGVVVSSTTSNPYAWTVPGSVTPGTYTITLTDTTNSAVTGTTGTFTIEAAPDIILQLPSSTTTWIQGSIGPVVWDKEGTTGSTVTVSILRSGMTTIDATTSNDGSYNVPSSVVSNLASGAGYTVRVVVGSSSGQVSRTSESFQVSLPDAIAVSPLSSEGCSVGSDCSIVWSKQGTVGNVRVSLRSAATGISNVVVASTSISPHVWSVPLSRVPGTYSIRVEDVRDFSLYGETLEFQVHAEPSITVTSPTSGMVWTKGSGQVVEWDSTGSINRVDIVLSVPGGAGDTVLSSSENNDGSYQIQTGTLATWAALGGYTVTVRSSSGEVHDVTSSASPAFTVADSDLVSVVDPNPTTGCTIGSACLVYFGTGGTVTSVKIMWQRGSASGIIVASASSSPYTWTPGNNLPASDDYQIRIEDASNPSLFDITSNFPLHPTPSIALILPSAGTTWTQGTGAPVVWSSVGLLTGTLTFTLKRNGQPDRVLRTGEANDGVFSLSGGDVAGLSAATGYTLSVVDEGGTGTSAVSSGTFDIKEAEGVTVVNPQLDTACVVGTGCVVAWTTTGGVSSVDVVVVGGGAGGAANEIVVASGASSSPITWTVPLSMVPGEYFVRVRVAGGTAEDLSKRFHITSVSAVSITSPGANDIWIVRQGGTAELSWKVTDANDPSPMDSGVVIVTLDSSGSITHTITTSGTPTKSVTSNSFMAEYTMNVPVSFEMLRSDETTTGGTYTIRVTKGTWTSVSAPFIIRPAPSIRIDSPSSGDRVANGGMTSMTYSKTGAVGAVQIDLMKSGGHYLLLINEWSGSNQYQWNVPARDAVLPGNDYTLRLTSIDDPAIVADSPMFEIYEINSLDSISRPSAGSSIILGVPADISWTYRGTVMERVSIKLMQGGSLVSIINPSTECDGGYAWMTPTDGTGPAPGTGYTIVLEDVGGGTGATATSGEFDIEVSRSLKVVSVGSVVDESSEMVEGQAVLVRWETTNSVPNVKITLRNTQNNFEHVLVATTTNTGIYIFVLSSAVVGGINPFTGTTYDIVVVTAGSEMGITTTPSSLFAVARDTSSDESLVVIQPSLSQEVTIGAAIQIEWTFTPSVPSFNRVKIEILHRRGCRVNDPLTCEIAVKILSADGTNDGSLAFDAVGVEPGGRYLIRVTPLGEFLFLFLFLF